MTLPELMELMAKHRAVRVKTSEFEVELHPLAFVPDVDAADLFPKPGAADDTGGGMCLCGHALTEHSEHGLCLRGCGSDVCGPMSEARHDS